MLSKVLRRYRKYSKLFVLFVILCIFIFHHKFERGLMRDITNVDQNQPTTSGPDLIMSAILPEPKIFCFICSQLKNLDTRAKAIYTSWGHKCTDYRFVSLVPNVYLTYEKIDTVYNNSFKILKPTGMYNDTYGNLTYKVLLGFEDIYKMQPTFDWFLKADDDTFIFYDNLRDFVATKNPKSPVTFGYDFKVNVEKGYHSGGGGYLLSNEAMNRLVSNWRSYNKAPGYYEDIAIAQILRTLGVYPESSIDHKGRERFHPLALWSHYLGLLPDWMFSYAKNPPRNGTDCCSENSISFHYTKTDEIANLAFYLDNKKKLNNNKSYAPLDFDQVYKSIYNKN